MRLEGGTDLFNQKIRTKKNSNLATVAWQKNAASYCYKLLFLHLRNQLICKGFYVMAER